MTTPSSSRNYVQTTLFPELDGVVIPSKPKKKSRSEKLTEQISQLQKEKENLQTENAANLQKIAEQQKEIDALKKKAEAFDDLLQSRSLFPVGIIAKNYGMSAVELNKYLQRKKIQFSDAGVWKLYAKYQKCGYTRYCWYNYSVDLNGRPKSRAHMYWTAKGMAFIRELLIADGCIED